MTILQAQLLIDYFASIDSIAPLVESRIWVAATPPEAVHYNPGQGAAILITRRGGRPPYTRGVRSIAISTRVYGIDEITISAVTDRLDEAAESGHQIYRAAAILDSSWQQLNEPGTGWLAAFAFWTIHLRVGA